MAVTTDTFSQYAGELYMLGNDSTPLLAAMGQEARFVNNFDFALSSSYTIASGTQQVITETDSLSAGSISNYTRDQAVNTAQIVKYDVATSYKLLSSYNKLIGNASDYGSVDGLNSIDDVHNHQIEAVLKQIYTDLNYSCWNGNFQRSTSAGVAAKTRGLVEAITTNVTTISGISTLTKNEVDTHLAGLADGGVPLDNIVCCVGSAAKIKLSDLYSLNLQLAPRDRTVGGVNIQTIQTDFCSMGIMFDAHIPSGAIYFINMSMLKPVWCVVPNQGALFYEEKATAGASRQGMVYGQFGLDYGEQKFHSVMKTA